MRWRLSAAPGLRQIVPVDFLEKLRLALEGELPGPLAQYRLAPDGRPGPETALHPPPDARTAAILIVFYEQEGELCFPMIRRPVESGPHSGQISFPGGAAELQDESFAHTALRETWEEIGVPAGDVRLLGALTPLYVAPSNFQVYPYVGWLRRRPEFQPDPREVAQVLEFRLSDILAPENLRTEEWELHGRRVRVPHYVVGGAVVWGASAMILSEMAAVINALDGKTDA